MYYGNVYELKSGIKVIFSNGSRFKSNNISLDFIISRKEINSAAANLLTKIIANGTEKYPDNKTITDRQNDLFATEISFSTINKGNYNCYGIIIDYLKKDYTDNIDITPDIVDFFDQFVFHPYRVDGLINPEYFEIEKNNLILKLKNLKKNKALYTKIRCLEKIYQGSENTPYSNGTLEEITALTNDDVEKAYCDLLSKSKIVINCVGDFDIDAVLSSFENIFGGLNCNNASFKDDFSFKPEKINENKFDEFSDVKQGQLCLGYVLNSDFNAETDMNALTLLHSVLYISPTSKLFMNVREKQSLCYTCSLSIDRYTNVMVASLGINFEDYEKALNAVNKEMNNCKKGIISDEELSNAKKQLLSDFRSELDTTTYQRGWNLNEIFRERSFGVCDFAERLKAVTVNDIMKVANKFSLYTVYYLKGESNGE